MKYKWTYEWFKSFRQIVITLVGKTLSGEIFVGRNFRHFSKNSSLSPDKVSPDKVPRVHPVQIASLSDYCITVDIVLKHTKYAEKMT